MSALWIVNRAAGLVALLLLTVVVVLGARAASARDSGTSGAVVAGLHRTMSLLAVVFTVVHVLTSVLDSYVDIPLAAVVIPGASTYQVGAVAVGAVAIDLLIAVVVTSLFRFRLGRRVWWAVHVLAYGLWAMAAIHALLAGTDTVLTAAVVLTGAVAVLVAVWTRVGADGSPSGVVRPGRSNDQVAAELPVAGARSAPVERVDR